MMMRNASPRSPKNRIASLEHRRRRLLSIVLDTRPLIIGTVYTGYQRCGKPGCHCARGRGHPKTLLMYKAEGRQRCKVVRKADVQWVRAAGQRYREFRAAVRALRALGAKEVEALMGLAHSRAVYYT